jgi:hypothetical protein
MCVAFAKFAHVVTRVIKNAIHTGLHYQSGSGWLKLRVIIPEHGTDEYAGCWLLRWFEL